MAGDVGGRVSMEQGGPLLAGLAVLVCVAASCSAGADGGPTADARPSTTPGTTAEQQTTTRPEPDLPEDAVWVLDAPDLTFVRADDRDAVGLGGSTAVGTVAGTELVLEYRSSDGRAVFVEQADLLDPDRSMGPVVDRGGAGLPPTLTTVVGTERVVISAEADDLRRLAETLVPIDRSALEDMVHEASAQVIDDGIAEPVVDGVTFHRSAPGADPLACLDGEEPEGCAHADRFGPMVMAPIEQPGGGYTVVGCIDQPIPVAVVVVTGRAITPKDAPCGQAFATTDIARGDVAITFDDGPGGVGTYTFTLR